VACDIYRPAAIKQLEEIGKSLDIPVFSKGIANPIEIIHDALNYAQEQNLDYINLMVEIFIHL